MGRTLAIVIAGVVGLSAASSARACLNDSSVKAAEVEFRSRYGNQGPTNVQMPANIWGNAALLCGLSLAMGPCFIALQRWSKRK